MSRLQPLMRMLVVLLAAVLLADAAWAWLPTTTELRRMWLRDRELSHPIHLSYRNPDQTDGFDVMIRPDGLWGKRIVRNREITRTVWKWGPRIWIYGQAGGATMGQRSGITWDDWLFDPAIDQLLALTPADMLDTRGLGAMADGQDAWIFGARHEQAAPPWFAVRSSPMRMLAWETADLQLGQVHFEYGARERYPNLIRFDRSDQELRFRRTAQDLRARTEQYDWTIPASVRDSAVVVQTRRLDGPEPAR